MGQSHLVTAIKIVCSAHKMVNQDGSVSDYAYTSTPIQDISVYVWIVVVHCVCVQPDYVLCQEKRGQVPPSGRTTWHRGPLYGSMTYWSG